MSQTSVSDLVVEVIDVNEGASHGNPSHPIVWDDTLYFSAKDGFDCSGGSDGIGDELGEYGRELFSAGPQTGPQLVRDINTSTSGNCAGVSKSLHEGAAALPGALVFEAQNSPFSSNATGFEPWRTNGTTDGTELVKDIQFGDADSNPWEFATVLGGNAVAFAAEHPTHGNEPWITTDGTVSGTFMLADIADDYDSNPRSFTPLDSGRFVFAADDDDVLGEELYVSDGSSVALVANINPDEFSGSSIAHLTSVVGQSSVVFFAYDPTAGTEPWVSDGTTTGTARLGDINPDSASSNTSNESSVDAFTQVGDLVFFAADDGVVGSELWVTDGTPAGTRLVADLRTGSFNGFFGHGAAFKDLLFFGADGSKLWTSDGTEAGTQLLLEGLPGPPQDFTVVGDILYFTIGTELWATTGTAEGTAKVASFANRPDGLTAVGPSLLAFRADREATGKEIFLAYDADILPPPSEVCDNGVDDDDDGLVDLDDPDCPVGLMVRCTHDPIYPASDSQTVSIRSEALDDAGQPVEAELLEIWLEEDTLNPTPEDPNATSENSRSSTLISVPSDDFLYGCRAKRGNETFFSGWSLVRVGAQSSDFPAIPIRLHGSLDEKIDIVFFPDRDEYSSASDPGFIADVQDLIYQGFFTVPWFLRFQKYFNFWLGTDTANSGPDPDDTDSSDGISCLREPPERFKRQYNFVDAAGIVHRTPCRDNAGSPGMFTITVDPNRLQVVAHEAGHRPFGLADEYCCDGGYFTRQLFGPPFPNLFKEESGCRRGAEERGFDPDACRLLVEEIDDGTNKDWYLFESYFSTESPRPNDLMQQTGCATPRKDSTVCRHEPATIVGPDSDPNGIVNCSSLATTYRGDPDGTGFNSDDRFWLCVQRGTATTAVWQKWADAGSLNRYDVNDSETDRMSWLLIKCLNEKC